MKFITVISSLIVCFSTTAQTPYLSVTAKMDSAKSEGHLYKIEMKLCEPTNASDRGDWFKPDSSRIDFASLTPADISCKEYFENRMPELISGKEEKKPVNQFKYGNQVFAWEKILVFRISHQSSRGLEPEMYIVMPVIHKAFITFIHLNDIEFQSGKLMFVTDMEVSNTQSRMTLTRSLNGYKTTEAKDSPLKTLLEE